MLVKVTLLYHTTPFVDYCLIIAQRPSDLFLTYHFRRLSLIACFASDHLDESKHRLLT